MIGAVLDRNGLRPSRYWVTDDDLVVMAVTGQVSAPTLTRSPYRPNTEGTGTVLIGMSGIVYNARVGDRNIPGPEHR